MKRVLITGENSYIGNSFEIYVKKYYPNQFIIETCDMHGEKWKIMDFSSYDAIFHVAGIAHVSVGKTTDKTRDLYRLVNTELAVDTAKKAKQEGVSQFVFMSSSIIYGDSAPLGRKKIINKNSIPAPSNAYGISKWLADKGIRELETKEFKVSVIRSPMVYGKGSKGNYPSLAKIAKKLPFFPDIKNQRSMIYIENLCEFVCQIILRKEAGIFWPQNREYVQTSDMVRLIAKSNKHKILVSKAFNGFVYAAALIPGRIGSLTNKAFGNMIYDPSISRCSFDYLVTDFKTSIIRTEK